VKKILLASLIGLAAVGCQNSGSKTAGTLPPSNSAVTDVAAAPAYTAPTPQPVQQPVIYDAPAVSSTPVGESSSVASASSKIKSGSQYKVQKGDTLFAIAKKTYGDGKQWKKIQAANPGLTASTLKVGQTITIP
jgi:nucleoid-associated protein YgaU